MKERIRVHAGEPLRRFLSDRGFEGSHGINALADRYQRIVAAVLPRLEEWEWIAVFDALKGIAFGNGVMQSPDLLRTHIARTVHVEDEKLAAYVEEWEAGTVIAVLDAAERWHTRPTNNRLVSDVIPSEKINV